MDNDLLRVARIFEACQTPLGFSMRGVASWDQELLHDWRDRHPVRLSLEEVADLERIERQVFGRGHG